MVPTLNSKYLLGDYNATNSTSKVPSQNSDSFVLQCWSFVVDQCNNPLIKISQKVSQILLPNSATIHYMQGGWGCLKCMLECPLVKIRITTTIMLKLAREKG